MLGAEEITFLSRGLGFLSALLLFHLSSQEEEKKKSQLYLHRSRHHRSHLGTQPCEIREQERRVS